MTLGIGALAFGCGQTKRNLPSATEPATPADNTNPPIYLYVASGACYGGDTTANAIATGSNTITRYHLDSGTFDKVIFDYNTLASGDQPASIIDNGKDELLVLIENAGSRRIDLLDKNTGQVRNYLTNSIFTTVMRDFTRLSDGSLLISKSASIEKFNENKSRITSGASPFINAPAAPCATSTTLMTSVVQLSNGLIAYTHAATAPNNRLGIVKASGYVTPTDCLAGITMATTTALPTALLEERDGDVLVSSGSATTASNFIYSYQVNTSSGAISNPIPAYTDFTYISAPSAMIQDPTTGDIYVASARATLNSIERLTYDTGSRTLTRNAPTYSGNSIYTRCVSGLAIGE